MDFTATGTQIGAVFGAIGNGMLWACAGLIFVMVVIIGMSLLAVPINRRIADFVKGNVGWEIIGVGVLAGAGAIAKQLGSVITKTGFQP